RSQIQASGVDGSSRLPAVAPFSQRTTHGGLHMIWRVALVAAAVFSVVDVTPASAQRSDEYGRRPFWESPRDRGWRNDPYEDDWYRGNDNGDGYGRQGDIRSGGPRPVIYPKAPPKIAFQSTFAPNSIIIDSEGRKLYFILSSSEAYAYPIS